ncbi:MAG: ELM1/GtrOC1 family putative glycosyltransferase, partial [Alphaproteobacteria bacterium]
CSYHHYAQYADIVLSPCFLPVIFDQAATSYPERQVRIDHTCAPSRMRFDITKTTLFPKQPPTNNAKPKIIATYIREPDEFSLDDLLFKFKTMHEKHNCQFLVSTGPCTNSNEARRIGECLAEFPGSEFFIFSASISKGLPNPFKDFLERADAIVVTDDTVSTLSDAVATGKTVFLHALESNEYYSGPAKFPDVNYLLQQALMQQGRIKYFTEKNLMSGWRPVYINEWKEIADKITGIMQERKLAIRGAVPPKMPIQPAQHSG